MSTKPSSVLERRIRLGQARASRWLAGRDPGVFGRFSRPDSIALLLTERCSARCVHCDIWRNRGVERGPADEDWRQALDELRDWLGPVPVVFTGGEALLRPFTIDLVRHGGSIGLQIEVLTHGYWRDQDIIESLALAQPWRVTVSLDGLGRDHDRIRGREAFFERTSASLATLARMREERDLDMRLRLKTVIMRHNLHAVTDVAHYAAELGADVFYQPIEQNYNTDEDPDWMSASDNWPDDVDAAVEAIARLAGLKRQGLPIVNSELDFQRMAEYFRDPDRYRIRIQNHDFSLRCAALSGLQVQANGDVKACINQPPIGNILTGRLRDLWSRRPPTWNGGCCLPGRMSARERADAGPRA